MTVTLRDAGWHGAARNSALAEAIRQVEAALEPPCPGAESEWIIRANQGLRAGARALATHRAMVDSPDGLYEQVEDLIPRAEPHLRDLRQQSQDTLARADHQQQAAHTSGQMQDVEAVLARARELAGALWRLQEREVELLVQAYEQDIGGGD